MLSLLFIREFTEIFCEAFWLFITTLFDKLLSFPCHLGHLTGLKEARHERWAMPYDLNLHDASIIPYESSSTGQAR